MDTINTLKNDLTKNFDTLKLHITDIVAATESGFGSQPIDTLSNWIIGHILVHRIALFSYYNDILQTELASASKYPTSYLSPPTNTGSNERKSYATLLIDLKQSQPSVDNLLDSLEAIHLESGYKIEKKDINNNSYPLSDLLTDTIQVTEETPMTDVLSALVEKESKLTLEFVQEQRQNSKTGIY